MKIIGHRGARGLAPENTIASFKKALQHNVDEIECDLRVTKDGVVVLHHNRHLIDPNGRRRRIAQHTYQDLLSHKSDLATLPQLLETLQGTVPLYLEVKRHEPTAPIISILREYLEKGWKTEDFRLASFDFKILQTLHRTFPSITTIVNESWSGVRARNRARKLGTKRISMYYLWLWSGFVYGTSRRGYQLAAYPLNSTRKARRWQRYGLYGVVTDYPDRFQDKS
jgi:glycerophosphoryl diester phosphodiesterase